MRRVISTALITLLVLAMGVSAWANCVGDQPDSRARMKCCLTAHHKCGAQSAPDDCCRKMRDGGPNALRSTVAQHHATAPAIEHAVALPLAAQVYFQTAGYAFAGPAFPRLHDPPHLHSFALLI